MSDIQDKDMIAHLKNAINLRDKDIQLAATYGKQLNEENAALKLQNAELSSIKEILEQEKYSLQLELETCKQAVNSLTNELEFQRDHADDLVQKLKVAERENSLMFKKTQNIIKENQYFKKEHDDLDIENKALNDKIKLYEKQIKNFQEQAEKSLCEAEKEDNTDLQAQLNTYMLNNKELQDALSESQCQLEMEKRSKYELKHIIKDLEETNGDKDAEIRASNAEIKKIKEEMEELQAEIEILKFDQVDTKRRGNSVFAELDDRRTIIEKEYKKMQIKFEHLKKSHETNKEELNRARGQVAILQSVASRDYQQSYIDKLEESLSTAQCEIQELQNKLNGFIKQFDVKNSVGNLAAENSYEYLRIMLRKLQQEKKQLQNEIMTLRNRNMCFNNKIIETQKLHYKVKQELDSAQQENARLKIVIQDMEQGVSPLLTTSEHKPNVDVFEGFQPESEFEKLNKSIYLPDVTIIPGELELEDDGFQPIRPPRKSNKFILQEFNRVENEDETKIDNELQKEDTVTTVPKENAWTRSKHRYRSKGESNKKNDNCAQQ